MNIKSILSIMMLICLIAAAHYEVKAQCPPEYDCEVPPDDDGSGNNYFFYEDCQSYVASQGWNPDGSTWMRICQACTKCYPRYDENENETFNCFPVTGVNCSYINKWGSASTIDPSKDIEALAFTDLIAVMEDLTRRAQMTTRI